MVKKCCVYTCRSESYAGCNISFHRFPNNEEMQKKWLSSIQVKQNITKNSVVCGRHFAPSCFYMTASRRFLKATAIPTISPMLNTKRIEVPYKLLTQQPHSVTSGQEILHPATSLELSAVAGSNPSSIEEPLSKKLCSSNTKEVGVQTVSMKCNSTLEKSLRRKVKILAQRLNKCDNRLKSLQSLLLTYKKICKKFKKWNKI